MLDYDWSCKSGKQQSLHYLQCQWLAHRCHTECWAFLGICTACGIQFNATQSCGETLPSAWKITIGNCVCTKEMEIWLNGYSFYCVYRPPNLAEFWYPMGSLPCQQLRWQEIVYILGEDNMVANTLSCVLDGAFPGESTDVETQPPLMIPR